MSQQAFNTRITLKHDIEAHWNLAAGFIPKKGEIVIYDIDETHDYNRIKIGDGVKAVSVNGDSYHADALPFYSTIKDDGQIVTKESIEAAQGYTSANHDEVWEYFESVDGRISDVENSASSHAYEFYFQNNGDGTYEADGGNYYEEILDMYGQGYRVSAYTYMEDGSLYVFKPYKVCEDCIVFTSPEFEVRHYEDGRWQMTKNSSAVQIITWEEDD